MVPVKEAPAPPGRSQGWDCHPADRPYRLTDALARPTVLVNNYAIVLGARR